MSKLLSIQEERDMAIKLCDCSRCELRDTCSERYKPRRLPGELFLKGIDSCPKIRNMRF